MEYTKNFNSLSSSSVTKNRIIVKNVTCIIVLQVGKKASWRVYIFLNSHIYIWSKRERERRALNAPSKLSNIGIPPMCTIPAFSSCCTPAAARYIFSLFLPCAEKMSKFCYSKSTFPSSRYSFQSSCNLTDPPDIYFPASIPFLLLTFTSSIPTNVSPLSITYSLPTCM